MYLDTVLYSYVLRIYKNRPFNYSLKESEWKNINTNFQELSILCKDSSSNASRSKVRVKIARSRLFSRKATWSTDLYTGK